MYIIQNALKNLGRNKKRNILFSIIILAIVLTTSIATIINSTTATIIKDYKGRFGAEVNITPKFGSNGFSNDLSNEDYLEFSKSEYIKDTIFTSKLNVVLHNIKALDDDEESGAINESGGQVKLPNAILKGFSNLNVNSDFQKNKRRIIKGKLFEKKNEIIISEQLALLNNLTIGDKIIVRSHYVSAKGETEKLTITGIYEDFTKSEDYGMKHAISNRSNEILTSFETTNNLSIFKYGGMSEASYFLKNPQDFELFKKELQTKNLSNNYEVSINDSEYKKVVGPMENMTTITNNFMIIVLVLGIIILTIISTMTTQERKYEIGVLRAMGMKKYQIVFGNWFEILTITTVCLFIGITISSLLTQPITDNLLKEQIKIAEISEQDGSSVGDIITGTEDVEPLSKIKIHLNIETLLQIIFITYLMVTISSVISILNITKYEPRKILAERN